MTKIKLSLPTGNSVEKSLLSAFSVGEKKYVVMDAESVGSMGLPIILVSAFSGEKLSKILDQNEWTSVKEALKSIISGGNVQYINIPQSLTADEIFYNQLTLHNYVLCRNAESFLRRCYIIQSLLGAIYLSF
mgnify:CR=1 FL=1